MKIVNEKVLEEPGTALNSQVDIKDDLSLILPENDMSKHSIKLGNSGLDMQAQTSSPEASPIQVVRDVQEPIIEDLMEYSENVEQGEIIKVTQEKPRR